VRLTEVWFLPYSLFWLWVIVFSVLLIRRAGVLPGRTGP
jgi:hypothetical protein